MEGTGLDIGVMLGFRNPPAWRRAFADVYRDELALAEAAEAMGYDHVWLTEHHFADDGYSPSIVPLAAAIAARTERIRIGFNLLLLPLHHAVQVAEDVATLDVLSDGRIDVGVGTGYARHEFAGYGIDRTERLGRFREGLDVLQGLWANPTFSYQGDYYRIEDARLSPPPVQQPPPLWIGASSIAGVRRAGRRGAHLLGLTNPRLQAEYDAALTAAGWDPARSNALQLHWVHVGADDDAAWSEAAPHFHHLLEVYAGWLNDSEDPGDARAVQAIPPVAELRRARPTLFTPVFGGPGTVVAGLAASVARVRTTHVALGLLPGMDPAVTRASLARFAAEVAPTLG